MTTKTEFHSEKHHLITLNFSSFASSLSKQAYYGAGKYRRAWCTGWDPGIRSIWNSILQDLPNYSPFMKHVCCAKRNSLNRAGSSSNGTSSIYNCFVSSTISSHLLSLAHYCSLLILASSTKKWLDTWWVSLYCIDLHRLQLCALEILQVVYYYNIAGFIINSNYVTQITIWHNLELGSWFPKYI